MQEIDELRKNNLLDKYGTFEEIDNPELKAWNRCAACFNIVAAESYEDMKTYASHFNEESKGQMSKIFNRIKSNGYEKTLKEIKKLVIIREDQDEIAS